MQAIESLLDEGSKLAKEQGADFLPDDLREELERRTAECERNRVSALRMHHMAKKIQRAHVRRHSDRGRSATPGSLGSAGIRSLMAASAVFTMVYRWQRPLHGLRRRLSSHTSSEAASSSPSHPSHATSSPARPRGLGKTHPAPSAGESDDGEGGGGGSGGEQSSQRRPVQSSTSLLGLLGGGLSRSASEEVEPAEGRELSADESGRAPSAKASAGRGRQGGGGGQQAEGSEDEHRELPRESPRGHAPSRKGYLAKGHT